MLDIWRSFAALPNWVKIWMVFILAPINMATLAFVDQPMGLWIAALAWGGLLLTTILIIIHRGFPKVLAIGHIPTWIPLVLLLIFARPDGSASYAMFLNALLAANAFSLIFDLNDLRIWRHNRRAS